MYRIPNQKASMANRILKKGWSPTEQFHERNAAYVLIVRLRISCIVLARLLPEVKFSFLFSNNFVIMKASMYIVYNMTIFYLHSHVRPYAVVLFLSALLIPLWAALR